MMKNSTIIERFFVALTSRFCAAEFSNRIMRVSFCEDGDAAILLLLDDITRIDDEVVLLT
jgi:hypothetical protein